MDSVPRHIAIIMDGNGRWASKRGLARTLGHRASVKVVRHIVESCVERGVRFLTLFAFSSENFLRPADEVSVLMTLFLEALDREVAELDRNGVRLRFIGDRASLGRELQQRMAAAESLTAGNSRLDLIVAMAYGGRWDIAAACRSLAREVATGALAADAIDVDAVAARLSLAGLPDPDLMIRTGGEQRISNFLLWNLAYSELYFTEVEWPDFDGKVLDTAIESYAARQRRFGKTSAQIEAEAENEENSRA
jgi:undecaprenyl diphosphate synthase